MVVRFSPNVSAVGCPFPRSAGVLALLVMVTWLAGSCGTDDSAQAGDGYQAVSVGSVFTCSLSVGGQVRCWGQNEAHEEKGLTDAPRRGTYKAVSAGYYGSCALRANGRLKCWGRVDGMTPFRKFTAFDMGSGDVCAIQKGTAGCSVGGVMAVGCRGCLAARLLMFRYRAVMPVRSVLMERWRVGAPLPSGKRW